MYSLIAFKLKRRMSKRPAPAHTKFGNELVLLSEFTYCKMSHKAFAGKMLSHFPDLYRDGPSCAFVRLYIFDGT